MRRPLFIRHRTTEFTILDLALLPFSIRVYDRPQGYGFNSGKGFCAVDGYAFGRVILLWPFDTRMGRVTSFFFRRPLILTAAALFVGHLLTHSGVLAVAAGLFVGVSLHRASVRFRQRRKVWL